MISHYSISLVHSREVRSVTRKYLYAARMEARLMARSHPKKVICIYRVTVKGGKKCYDQTYYYVFDKKMIGSCHRHLADPYKPWQQIQEYRKEARNDSKR